MPLLGRKTDAEKVEQAAAKEASRQAKARSKLRGAFDRLLPGRRAQPSSEATTSSNMRSTSVLRRRSSERCSLR